ncbi:unnamed protein product [Notodromas monacha]|uniref:Uncharacterized protein n=1 Tax=Notodromas monacha TaxID=399045 RepID=A0A7R9C0W5_9CRUS|nr:unnamed protein product [Notodromas monacha]CAG0923746.1 unnamed protein product [Notodromas monacha]
MTTGVATSRRRQLPSTARETMMRRSSQTRDDSTEANERATHEEAVQENIEVGFMFASKAFVQLLANPFVGPLTNRIGYSIPMFAGFFIMFLSTLILQLLVLQPKVMADEVPAPSLKQLLKDPYIMVVAEPSLPLWMRDTMKAPVWQHGAAFLPASISYLIGTNLFGPLGHRLGRWLASLLGLVIIGICLTQSILDLVPPLLIAKKIAIV